MFPLLTLPNELIDAIVSAVGDRPTLIALAQTCEKLQPFAEAQLFKDIYIHDGSAVKRLAMNLDWPPWRAKAIEHLEVTPSMHSYRGTEEMPELIAGLKNLKRLKLEAPMINSGTKPSWWSEEIMGQYMDMFSGRSEGLGRLTSFTLHSHGTDQRYYNIRQVLPVFLSPTLKHLHLSCIDLDGATKAFSTRGPEIARTPLETLIIQRCDVRLKRSVGPSVYPDELGAVLSRPRALRSLTLLIDALLEYDGQLGYAPDFLQAIVQHSDSLEYLRFADQGASKPPAGLRLDSHVSTALSALREVSSGLSTFQRLHTFYVWNRSILAELLIDKALAPPNLRILGLTGLDYVYEESWRHLPVFVSAVASATSFSHLRLHTNPSGWDIADVSENFSRRTQRPHASPWTLEGQPPARMKVLNVAEILDKRGTVKLVCSRFARQNGRFVPPFLHGEPLPNEAVIFDSGKPWSEEEGSDRRFSAQDYISDDGDVSGWHGPFSALGNTFWK